MKFALNFVLGTIFGAGLILSGIFQTKAVITFLNPHMSWNASFLYTLIGMMLVTLLLFVTAKVLEIKYHYIFYNLYAIIAIGLTGDPVPPTNFNGKQINKNSYTPNVANSSMSMFSII